jgi:hypothetical protein
MHVSMSRTGIDLPVPERPYHFVISADQLLVVLVKEDQRHRVRERDWPSRPMGWGERALGRLHLHATTCSTAGAEDTGQYVVALALAPGFFLPTGHPKPSAPGSGLPVRFTGNRSVTGRI